MLENIHELLNFETRECISGGLIISGNFPRAEIKLFQSDVDEGCNNFNNFISHSFISPMALLDSQG